MTVGFKREILSRRFLVTLVSAWVQEMSGRTKKSAGIEENEGNKSESKQKMETRWTSRILLFCSENQRNETLCRQSLETEQNIDTAFIQIFFSSKNCLHHLFYRLSTGSSKSNHKSNQISFWKLLLLGKRRLPRDQQLFFWFEILSLPAFSSSVVSRKHASSKEILSPKSSFQSNRRSLFRLPCWPKRLWLVFSVSG